MTEKEEETVRILVINGECIQVNTSSNLCNLAYLRGLVDAGHDVTLISADGRDYTIDGKMTIPPQVTTHTYYSVSLYEKLSLMKNRTPADSAAAGVPTEKPQEAGPQKKRSGVVSTLKKGILSLYGVHSIYGKFAISAMRFRSDEEYDAVISLCTPAASHLLAHRLLKTHRVKAKHWIQIWEDPWYAGVDTDTKNKKVYKEEKRLLSLAEHVCYVSPITLAYQKALFPESADKMFWAPLPAYYQEETEKGRAEPGLYGYFGEYSLPGRDLEPFYIAARECGIKANICGNSNRGFVSTDKIRIYPRLPLGELRPLEEKTEVLVFLCNCRGGQIPGKIYQYSATDKTILFILDGTKQEKKALRDYFEPYDRFVFCENTAEDIKAAICRLRSGDLGGVKNTPLEDFTPERIVRRILEEGMK